MASDTVDNISLPNETSKVFSYSDYFFQKRDRLLNVSVIVFTALTTITFIGMALSFYLCPVNPFPGNAVYMVGAVCLTMNGILATRMFVAYQHLCDSRAYLPARI